MADTADNGPRRIAAIGRNNASPSCPCG
ncbi:protein of unknown function (plasmid) [Azospirillum baldaniorum]|uniref:Uncharacterized protein n=1 Tax=Azospirillum baldaniorum TaxID=1064539 RepID=A0A9P1NNR0_9PROT|nr:protein of unknown function [Azospirillum baldaniorum]